MIKNKKDNLDRTFLFLITMRVASNSQFNYICYIVCVCWGGGAVKLLTNLTSL